MIDDYMFPATYPWNHLLDSQIRSTMVVDPDRRDNRLAVQNRQLLVEMGTVMGHEGDDFQNPNVWQGKGVLVYPSEHAPGLVPTFGIGVADNYADVVLNVKATRHLAVINV